MSVEKTSEYLADSKAMNIVVDALLTKMQDSVVTGGMDPDAWNALVDNLTKGVVTDNSILKKVISVDLLATVLSRGKFVSCEIVEGSDIESSVEEPDVQTLYLLHDPKATNNNLTVWIYLTSTTSSGRVVGTWYSLAGIDIPEFTYVNTTDPDHVNNIVAHIKRGQTTYNSSSNVRGYDIVTAKALTQVLVALGHANKIVIPYEPQSTIENRVPKPDLNAFYLYQNSPDKGDWSIYTQIQPNPDADPFWVELMGTNGKEIELPDMSLYWSKEELPIISEEDVIAMVNNAADSIGLKSV